jgi:hypothetical protein
MQNSGVVDDTSRNRDNMPEQDYSEGLYINDYFIQLNSNMRGDNPGD